MPNRSETDEQLVESRKISDDIRSINRNIIYILFWILLFLFWILLFHVISAIVIVGKLSDIIQILGKTQ